MTRGKDVPALLHRLHPVRKRGAYVFTVVPEESAFQPADVLATIREDEGVTLVVQQDAADRDGFGYDFVAAWITLEVESDLAAVGLTAAVSAALARAGISCNVLAGYYHDHLLVPVDRADEAMAILEGHVRDED